jgi:predicted acylesterase/phospholipase RssA
MHDHPPLAIALSGGGVRVMAALGHMCRMEKDGKLCDLRVMAASSSGVIPVLMYAAGFTFREMYKKLRSPPDALLSVLQRGTWRQAMSFLSHWGVTDGSELRSYLQDLLEEKTGKRNMSMIELCKRRNIHMLFVAACYDRRTTHVFSSKVDDVDVVEAALASMCFPFMMAPILIDGHRYVDGGLMCNYPLRIIDRHFAKYSDRTIGFIYETSVDDVERGEWPPRSIVSYLTCIIGLATGRTRSLERELCTDYDRRTFVLPTLGVRTFDALSPKECKHLFHAGYKRHPVRVAPL